MQSYKMSDLGNLGREIIIILKKPCAIGEEIFSSIDSFHKRCIPVFLLILFASPLAACDIDASSSAGNQSAASALLVLITPSQAQVSPGDAFNISYLVVNLGNFTMMNVSLATEENGTVDLNVSALLPGQSAGGFESINADYRNLTSPLIRRARAQVVDPLGKSIIAENSTSIDLSERTEEAHLEDIEKTE